MSGKIKTGLTVIAAVISVAFAQAQEEQKMPKALADFARLIGKWEGAATFTLERKTHMFTYYADFKTTADGSGMYMDEWFTAPELGAMKGANLLGYNNNDGKIHWFSVDNFGTAHDHSGSWKSQDHFFMQANEWQGKKKYTEKIDLTFNKDNTLGLLLVATLDNKEIERAIVTFHRSK